MDEHDEGMMDYEDEETENIVKELDGYDARQIMVNKENIKKIGNDINKTAGDIARLKRKLEHLLNVRKEESERIEAYNTDLFKRYGLNNSNYDWFIDPMICEITGKPK